MKKLMNKKGMTLVEVIVVLVILAILAAVLVPTMVSWIDKANEKTILADARTIYLAAQTIASEDYGTGTIDPSNYTAKGEGSAKTKVDEIISLSGVSEGKAYSVSIVVTTSGEVTKVIYKPTASSKTATFENGKWTIS